MVYLDDYVNNKVSAPVLFIFVLQLDIEIKEKVVPNSFCFCIR